MGSIDVTIAIFHPSRKEIVKRNIEMISKHNNTTINKVIIVYGNAESNEFKNYYMAINEFASSYDNVIFMRNLSNGLSGARNTAIQNSTADYIAFIDDDALLSPEWFSNLYKVFKYNCSGYGGKVKPLFPPNLNLKGFPSEFHWIFGCTYPPIYRDHSHYIRNPIGANMIFKRKVLLKYGGFNSRLGRINGKLTSREETFLSSLMVTGGEKIAYVPSLLVFHVIDPDRINLKYALKRCYYEGKSAAQMEKITRNLGISNKLLKSEEYYLKFLVREIFKRRSFIFFYYTLSFVVSVGIGYLGERLRK